MLTQSQYGVHNLSDVFYLLLNEFYIKKKFTFLVSSSLTRVFVSWKIFKHLCIQQYVLCYTLIVIAMSCYCCSFFFFFVVVSCCCIIFDADDNIRMLVVFNNVDDVAWCECI